MPLTNEETELRLLLIDNDPVQSKVKSFALSKHFDIVRVKNTKDAQSALLLAQKQDSPFDLILIDMLQLGESYIDVNDLLKNIHYMNQPHIFVMSVIDTLQQYIEQMPLHKMDVVLKPISSKNLLQRIESHISDHKPARLKTNPFVLDDDSAQKDFHFFMQHLSKSWIECIRADEPVTLIALNIDYFQLLKAHAGNNMICHYLRMMMSILHSTIYRQNDLVVRSRRDDFYILLPGCSEIGAKHKIALINKFVVQALMPHDISPLSPFVSVSTGFITQKPNTMDEIQIFFDLARARLDQSKTLRDMAITQSNSNLG
ncbi:MAG: diguanylate cyclase [Glaciecola sp.]|jgi:diguanylate cyclase (GGDEF)-like protein|nr:diguanylate cyclase [Glaciecola sp.]MDG1814788.1 diguanylate cyclase [Glaciecola sp.]MDG2098933.1 diguanylate cyclase [Glaciecola sp.]